MEVNRRLVAVFAADVEGYSRLMGADEVGTLKGLTERRAILDKAIADHRGRIANTAGDSVLAEFGSAVDAMQCAVAAQTALTEANSGLATDKRIDFRIGIHVGDVMVRAGDLFGDGVNIAARLQTLAQPGGVCISGATYDQVRKVLPVAFTDLGTQQVKNIEEPVRAYAVAAISSSIAPSSASVHDTNKPLPLPDKPSIVVLAFQNMSGDPEQEYFADGMVEDITTALSRFRELFVIARNSAFAYKGKSPDIRRVGRELGVRYVLEGSVRRSGNRIRITGQLVEAATNNHLWADRFDGALEDVFDLQDRIVEQVVGAIGPKISEAEIERTKRKRPDNLDGYDHVLRAQALMQSRSADVSNIADALVHLERAIELQPDYALAHALAAECYTRRYIAGAITDFELESNKGIKFARRALALDKDDPEVLCNAGWAIANFDVLEDGVRLSERATNLNPNLSRGWLLLGLGLSGLGEPSRGFECISRALRLAPIGPLRAGIMANASLVLIVMGKHQDAYEWAERAYQEDANNHLAIDALAYSAALVGNLARANMAFQRTAHRYPARRERFRRLFRRPEDFEKLSEAMRLAGAPE